MCLCVSCRLIQITETDGITGATQPYTQNKIVLPPPHKDYEVLGVQEGLKNFTVRYDDQLYRGGELHANSAALTLYDWNVKTIISIAPSEYERNFCREHGFLLVEIPFDKITGPTATDLKCFKDTIRTGSGPFYMHCRGGSHRGGVLGVAYRVDILGWSYEKALVEFGRLGGDLRGDHDMLEAIREAKHE